MDVWLIGCFGLALGDGEGAQVAGIGLSARLVNGLYMDTFYYEVTGKTAFALIEQEKRVFGVDNTSSWHWHPFDNPDRHIPDKNPVIIEGFLKLIEDHYKIP